MRISGLFLFLFFVKISFAQTIYRLEKGKVFFRSDAPMELIQASSEEIIGLIDMQKKTFAFRIPVSSFEGFNSPLQREHFNENYLETDRFPNAQFSGTIDGDIDITKVGDYDVFAKGTLEIHGVKKARAIQSRISVDQAGNMKIQTEFIVPLKDHEIKIPTIVRYKIAETINVTFNSEMIKK